MILKIKNSRTGKNLKIGRSIHRGSPEGASPPLAGILKEPVPLDSLNVCFALF
jgi:hypothetical protein